MLQVHAAGLAAQFQHAERRRVVDVNGVLGHFAHGADDALELIVVELPVADGVHAGFGPDQALDDLLGGHFQGKEGDRHVVLLGGVQPNVE